MKKQVYYLSDTTPDISDYDIIKWTWEVDGEIIYTPAFKILIGLFTWWN